MAVHLLLDLGTSRIKAALHDDETRQFIWAAEAPAPEARLGERGEVEVSPDDHPRVVRELCDDLLRRAGVTATTAAVSSEMHGFLLADSVGARSPYVGWRDERAARGGVLGALQAEIGDRFRAITGMRLRAGLPFVTLVHLARGGQLSLGMRVLSLPEWTMDRLGRAEPVVDESLAAGLGLYDLGSRAWSPELLQVVERHGPVPALSRPVPAGEGPVGVIRLLGRDVPVVSAVGDLQAAVLGSGCPPLTSVCVNVGTGSQVSLVGVPPASSEVEVRPFFHGERMSSITHIPAGRALRTFETFFEKAAEGGGKAFWELLASVSLAEAAGAPLEVDLNVFSGAWRHGSGGAIGRITEEAFTPRLLAASILLAMARQYVDAIRLVDPSGGCRSVVLAGGLPRRLPALRTLLQDLTGLVVELGADGEETLLGLRQLVEARH